MPFAPIHSPAKQRQVAALMQGSDLTMVEIAAHAGVPYPTVANWNRAQGWRPSKARPSLARRVRRWPPGRVAALSRVYRVPGVDPDDLAEVLSGSRGRAEALFAACGFSAPTQPPAPEEDYRDPNAKAALCGRLRAHVARQIAGFDKKLACEGVGPDSVRVLRDLVGLKRLLDDLDAGAGGADEDGPWDVAALRADIARRYAAFEAQEARDAERAASRDAGDPDDGRLLTDL